MKRIGIFGLGQFGMTLVKSLADHSVELLAVDVDLDKVEAVKDLVTRGVALSSVSEETMAAAGAGDLDVAVVTIGEDFAASVLTAAILTRLKVPRIIARASTDMHEQVLRAVGAQETVRPEKEASLQLAARLLIPGLQTLHSLDTNHRIIEVLAPHDLHGKTLLETNFRSRFKLNIIAIRKVQRLPDGTVKESINDLPSGTDVIEEGDILILLGTDKATAAFVG
jgi:trk system potassium uptake protein TrkA